MSVLRLLLLIALAAGTSVAAPADRPWEQASEAERAEAERLRLEATDLYLDEQYLEAAGKFVAAVALWPHPKLHFSAAQAFAKLSRWREAAKHFELALAHGGDGLGEDAERARARLAEASTHTGIVVVRTAQAGAELSLDGELVVTGPGVARVRVDPGRHVVVARRGELSSEPVAVDVAAGAAVEAEPRLYVTTSQWRWPRWVPWTAISIGGAIGLVGVPVLVNSYAVAEDYDRAVDGVCPCPPGTLTVEAMDLRRTAQQRFGYAIGAFIGGGLIAAAGVALLGLNRQQQRRVLAPDAVTVSSWTDGRGVTVALRW